MYSFKVLVGFDLVDICPLGWYFLKNSFEQSYKQRITNFVIVR